MKNYIKKFPFMTHIKSVLYVVGLREANIQLRFYPNIWDTGEAV